MIIMQYIMNVACVWGFYICRAITHYRQIIDNQHYNKDLLEEIPLIAFYYFHLLMLSINKHYTQICAS